MKHWQYSKYLFFLVLLLHLPFLLTDPTILLDISRGAFTDEGLYLYQVRNLFMFGIFDMAETDGFLKTPIFNVLMAIPVAFNRMWLVRLVVLIAASLGFYSFWKKFLNQNIPILCLFVLLLSQATIFGHLHLAMSEVLVVVFLLLSVLATYSWENSNKYLGLFFLCVAVCCKIQYLDLLVLAIPYYMALKKKDLNLKKAFLVISPIAVTFLLYVLFKKDVVYMLEGQTGGKFQNFGNWIFRIKVNITNLSFDRFNILIFSLLVLSSVMVLVKMKEIKPLPKNVLLCLWIALLAESHKLIFIYLPQRYLFIWFVLITCITVYQFYLCLSDISIDQKWIGVLSMLMVVGFIIRYTQFYQARTFQIHNARTSISTKVPKGKLLVGPWAPSLSFGTVLQSHTAWNNYYQNEDLWKQNQSAFLISEKDFDDNKGLFEKEIGNYEITDSFTIKNWGLVVFKPKLD